MIEAMRIKLAGRIVAGGPVTHSSLAEASCRESGESVRGKSSDTGMASHGVGGGVLRKAANEKTRVRTGRKWLLERRGSNKSQPAGSGGAHPKALLLRFLFFFLFISMEMYYTCQHVCAHVYECLCLCTSETYTHH